jgi:hypothetical protein
MPYNTTPFHGATNPLDRAQTPRQLVSCLPGRNEMTRVQHHPDVASSARMRLSLARHSCRQPEAPRQTPDQRGTAVDRQPMDAVAPVPRTIGSHPEIASTWADCHPRRLARSLFSKVPHNRAHRSGDQRSACIGPTSAQSRAWRYHGCRCSLMLHPRRDTRLPPHTLG